ncbi:helix-turn-helix domain-containing protein [Amycolatopsis pithecellobii]|uniref:Helix-turn-helix domain-containing protein n=1 Tax=Amycolatopsis pithecellobii TaxID=664692 RepID=A0A6N7YZI8_9PSEU|nr:helix-turn-helix transcriptional regulator [Amycolatopsis pithecellobii]MTD57332.1 helix-turn-helix domain-containing protein [Amycolatopsis pithecellobii]
MAEAFAMSLNSQVDPFCQVHTDWMERTDVAKELGHFLRTRRERLGPIGDAGSRRTQGLRREEVAEKAAVSREYYTKLEQGRALNPSLEVLESVASALLLSSDEAMYVQDLAALLRGGSVADSPDLDGAPDSVGARLVDAINDRPALVVDHRLDITSWNDMAAEMLIDFASLPPHHRNLSWLVFTNPQVRSRCVQWGDVARQNVAVLRGGAGRHPNDQRMVQLVGDLSLRSNSFARLWASHDVLGRNFGTRIFEHPIAGQIELLYDAVHLPGPFDRHLTVYSARNAVAEQALGVLRSLCEARRQQETPPRRQGGL